MDYIPIDSSGVPAAFTIVGTLLAVAIVLIVLMGRGVFDRFSSTVNVLVTSAITLSLMGAISLGYATLAAPPIIQERDARAQIADFYGVSLSEDQFRALEYPATDPAEQSSDLRYGTIDLPRAEGSGFSQDRVSLVSKDGKLYLSDGEGKLIEPDGGGEGNPQP